MTKPFTELPAPKRTHRLSIVAVWSKIEHRCEHPKCDWMDAEEVSECPVCGRWMCEDCFGEDGVNIAGARMGMFSALCCDDCAKLTADERQAVMDLRAKIDQ